VFATGVLAVLALCASTPAKRVPSGDPLILDGADNIVVQGRGAMVVLTGNVRFHRGDVRFRSRSAVWDRATDEVRFQGDFRLDHPSGTLTSLSGRYERASGSAFADGDAHLVDSSGRVTLDAGAIRYDRDAHRAEASQSPVFRKLPCPPGRACPPNDTGRDTTEIRGETLVWRDADSVAEARGRVRLRRGSLVATCGKATMDERTSKLLLEQSPSASLAMKVLSGRTMVLDIDLRRERIRKVVVLQDARGTMVGDPDSSGRRQTERVFGDTLVADLDGDTLREVLVVHKARGTSFTDLDTTRRDDLWGDSLRLVFHAGKMKSAWIHGNARSVYHHMEKNVDKGRNEARGRTIRIAFDEGKIHRIRIEGAAKGTYYGTEPRKAD
jgi:lipopolysaccharide export system protein LptA